MRVYLHKHTGALLAAVNRMQSFASKGIECLEQTWFRDRVFGG